jgi:hypothetical protein
MPQERCHGAEDAAAADFSWNRMFQKFSFAPCIFSHSEVAGHRADSEMTFLRHFSFSKALYPAHDACLQPLLFFHAPSVTKASAVREQQVTI